MAHTWLVSLHADLNLGCDLDLGRDVDLWPAGSTPQAVRQGS